MNRIEIFGMFSLIMRVLIFIALRVNDHTIQDVKPLIKIEQDTISFVDVARKWTEIL